ncbi:rhodanese-like domain-containing protein [Chengkuizengella sediminis]|uniref:rhodanese-like domain-containing protein n=1 Tax=Chengkuizengella sediminis TaxID=1885917 RepID=UPI0013898228|nr:rhodanese-like domain-containing protein [Chengkuizengella sediminis]NDI34734.1 rhodanese-like domain-containing protein [Chengkuizengella sediminis]
MKIITPKEVEQLLKENKKIHIIDVREVNEIREGMIAGSMHIPLGLLEFRLHELNRSKEYIMVCRSGNRSGIAAQFLESQGFKVKNMIGGMLEWTGEVQKNLY